MTDLLIAAIHLERTGEYALADDLRQRARRAKLRQAHLRSRG